METAIAVADAHEDGARRALLERLATGLATIADPAVVGSASRWTCCWLSYTGPHGKPWLWQTCTGHPPGDAPIGPDGRYVHCGHWHHRWEMWIAS